MSDRPLHELQSAVFACELALLSDHITRELTRRLLFAARAVVEDRPR